ncbi:MAG: cell wall hydrolase [Alphaproteobacteria bacterium]|nr:cell wall hydrolase [Alphaproteobacteria bacterium]
MGRGSPRRIWHTVAALVPLPIVGLGVLAIVPTDKSSVELYLSQHGSEHARVIPSGELFGHGKGPRADHLQDANTVTSAGKQLIAASLTGTPSFTAKRSEVARDRKADRLIPTTTEVVRSSSGNPLLMNAANTSMFGPDLDVDAFRPSPEDIAYSPSPDALGFRYQGETQAEFEERERRCLATALYFESRGEPIRGQIAVGQVILNRVRSPNFPETICGVVFQGQHQPGCQFSFACDGKTDAPRNSAQWGLAQDLAKQIMAGEHWLPELGYSTYFHATYVSPYWRGGMSRSDRIGRHIFYKKRNEKPYIVEASTGAGEAGAAEDDATSFLMTPTLSVVSAVSSMAGSVGSSVGSMAGTTVSSLSGSSAPATPAMSLGYGASE